MEKNGIQLEMNFSGAAGNVFGENLDHGRFQLLAELPLPRAGEDPKEAAARMADLEYLVLSRSEPAALAFTSESAPAVGTVDLISFASALCRTSRDRHLLYLSGRDRSEQELFETARIATGEGFKNFCMVSGSPVPGEGASETFRRHFAESVLTLSRFRKEFAGPVRTGCTVNPYKYTPSDLCMQYFKLAKKFHSGASFAVAQYGWDMLKLQELRWNLFLRSMPVPTIARLLFLTPERADEICAGRVPGIRISPDLEVVLKREMQYSRAQFEAAQIRRLQIHAAGVRFLGYSGIQIAGADTPERLEILLDRIGEGMKEFTTFEHWRSAYLEYYERLDMAPYPYRFYLFENLFSSAAPPEDPVVCSAEIPPPSSWERFRWKLGRRFFSHASEIAPSERRLTKKLLFSCRSCKKCRLPQTFYVCPENCPLGLANGPCGASKDNGSCRFDGRGECVFLKQLRIVNSLREYSALEERLIPSGR